jgi:hypothetical protein
MIKIIKNNNLDQSTTLSLSTLNETSSLIIGSVGNSLNVCLNLQLIIKFIYILIILFLRP